MKSLSIKISYPVVRSPLDMKCLVNMSASVDGREVWSGDVDLPLGEWDSGGWNLDDITSRVLAMIPKEVTFPMEV